jgi:integrase
VGKLTAARVKHAKPGRHGDGRGLYLQVIGGSKTWVLRYEHRKRERWMGLGSVEFVTLAQARERAFELRRKLKDEKIDPLEHRRAAVVGARIAALTGSTFEQVAHRCIEMKSSEWRGDGSRREWLSTLERYAFPVLGSLPISSIDAVLVHRVLEPIWLTKPHVGQRLRERIEAILDYAKGMKLRSGENPALWRGNLEHMLPKANRTSRKHHPALPYAELPALMVELRTLPGIPARALELTILTAVRTGEARFACWSEIDLVTRVWTIPARRIKGGKEHRVPLSNRALAILRELPRESGSDAVFSGRSNGGFLNQDAMADVLAKLRPGFTVHGFRSTFRDWAAETTGYPNHVVEMALAHAIPNGVEAAYRRGDLFEKRRRLMEEWAEYCASPGRTKDRENVVRLREHA